MHIGLWVYKWIQISAKLDWISVLCKPVLYNIDLWTYFALYWFLQKKLPKTTVCLSTHTHTLLWHYFVIYIKVPHYHLQISWYHDGNAGNVAMYWYGNALQA